MVVLFLHEIIYYQAFNRHATLPKALGLTAFQDEGQPFYADKPRLQPLIIPESLSYERDSGKQRLFFQISFPSISVIMLQDEGAWRRVS